MAGADEADEQALRRRLRTLRARHHQILREYSEIKERVQEYGSRRWISQGEDLERRALQRAKLQKKDALVLLQRELDALESALAAAPAPGPR